MSCFARRTLQETVEFVLVSTVISDVNLKEETDSLWDKSALDFLL